MILGETLCYLALALLQALLIVVVGAVLFGVSWGNPLAAAALIGMWALVRTGAGMVSGTLFRTPEQATAIGPTIGIAFGMLGGCMWPLEIVPQSVRALGHSTPHAWAVDAWVTLLSRGGGLADIAGYLAILAGYAVDLFVLASLRLRHSLVTPRARAAGRAPPGLAPPAVLRPARARVPRPRAARRTVADSSDVARPEGLVLVKECPCLFRTGNEGYMLREDPGEGFLVQTWQTRCTCVDRLSVPLMRLARSEDGTANRHPSSTVRTGTKQSSSLERMSSIEHPRSTRPPEVEGVAMSPTDEGRFTETANLDHLREAISTTTCDFVATLRSRPPSTPMGGCSLVTF